MAVITFDNENNNITILVEKPDVICIKDDNGTLRKCGVHYSAGTVFINGNTELCMIRGERN